MNVGLKNSITFNGRKYKDFTQDNALDIAKVLQAALDMGNDPILLETGVNKHTISAFNAMLKLGVSLEEAIVFMRSPVIEKFVRKVDSGRSVFSVYQDQSAKDILTDYVNELSNVKLSGLESIKELELQAKRKMGLDKKFKVGAKDNCMDSKYS